MATKKIYIEATSQLSGVAIDTSANVYDLSTGLIYEVVNSAWAVKSLLGPKGDKGDTGASVSITVSTSAPTGTPSANGAIWVMVSA